ncbi:MAG: hydrogenase iron-sulfur subunit [Candidatus Sifarchaeia archaeon]|jgi:F420-non-reducing hydrogenase iron-sulfur subunit
MVEAKEMIKETECEFEPKLIGFLCNWCSYAGADLAGTSRVQYPPNIRIVRVMCTGRLDPQLILNTFRYGADGVLIAGCHEGDCHYIGGNYRAYRKYILLKEFVKIMGINEKRLRLEWVSASEGERFAKVVRAFGVTITGGVVEDEPEPKI